MKKRNVVVIGWLISGVLLLCAGQAAAQKSTIWMYCYIDATAKVKQKGGAETTEGRYYVTDLISMSVRQYKSIDPNPNSTQYFEEACVDYFDKVIVKAAEAHGEEVTSSGLSGLITNIDGPDVNSDSGYNLTSKEEVEKDRAERIESNKGPNRKIIPLKWDPTVKNAKVDLQRERRVVGSPDKMINLVTDAAIGKVSARFAASTGSIY